MTFTCPLGAFRDVCLGGLRGTASRTDTKGGRSAHGLAYAFARTARGKEAAEKSYAVAGKVGEVEAKLVYHLGYEGEPEHSLAANDCPSHKTLVPEHITVVAAELIRVGRP